MPTRIQNNFKVNGYIIKMPNKLITTPNKLEDWSVEIIKRLLEANQKENLFFDFKTSLPDKRNAVDKNDLRSDFCSFANSEGGFLIFGVNEKEKELSGFSLNDEVLPKLNDILKEISPSISFGFNTLKIDSDKELYVVHIPKSRLAPHSFLKDSSFVFKRRVAGSNVSMTYEEVRLTFMHNAEKLAKFDLFKVQLFMIKELANRYVVDVNSMDKNMSAVSFDTTLLNLSMAESYSFFYKNRLVTVLYADLIRLISDLVFKAKSFAYSPQHHGTLINHNTLMNNNLLIVAKKCDELLSELAKVTP